MKKALILLCLPVALTFGCSKKFLLSALNPNDNNPNAGVETNYLSSVGSNSPTAGVGSNYSSSVGSNSSSAGIGSNYSSNIGSNRPAASYSTTTQQTVTSGCSGMRIQQTCGVGVGLSASYNKNENRNIDTNLSDEKRLELERQQYNQQVPRVPAILSIENSVINGQLCNILHVDVYPGTAYVETFWGTSSNVTEHSRRLDTDEREGVNKDKLIGHCGVDPDTNYWYRIAGHHSDGRTNGLSAPYHILTLLKNVGPNGQTIYTQRF